MIMENKTALNRIFIKGKNSCLITLKNHKLNFSNKPGTRPLKPANNELGKINKVILDNKLKPSKCNSIQLAEKQRKIVSLFHLILKIFTPKILRNPYQNA